tara:strand:- start:143 stop:1399 length:1257 start_codon:yes stop_codon:yes gene_type:complete
MTKLQPHFPGYPIFCFLAILLYNVTGSLGLAFSIIGGISIYLIIYSSLNLLKIELKSIEGALLTLFILFNPLFWLMSNRYMPDLLGLAFCILSFYYLSLPNCKKSNYIGVFLSGLLIGIRLSYIPILFIPIIKILQGREINLKFISSFILGILLWFIPLIYIEGFNQLILLGYKHTLGHFFDYGGTIITESDLFVRFKFLLQTIWSDGLGGFWKGRSWITLLSSTLLIPLIYNAISIKIVENKIIKKLLLSSLIYIVWIMLFQNLIYKSRHVMPLVLILILFIFSQINKKNIKVMVMLYLLAIIPTTYSITNSHRQGTAIFKLLEYKLISNSDIIITNQLINYYLKANGNTSKFYNIERTDLQKNKLLKQKNKVIIGNYTEKFKKEYSTVLDTIFFHNPYMNRMWSEIPIYTLNDKIE